MNKELRLGRGYGANQTTQVSMAGETHLSKSEHKTLTLVNLHFPRSFYLRVLSCTADNLALCEDSL